MKHTLSLALTLVLSFAILSPIASYACSDAEVTNLIQEAIESDQGVGVISYGNYEKGQTLKIEDMEKNNEYTVTNDSVDVFSAHGSYFSGYFIFVLEVDKNQCKILNKYLIYEE